MNLKSMLLSTAVLACFLPMVSAAQVPMPTATKPLAHTYRLTYTLILTEGGKRTGMQHFSMVISAPTNRGSIKLGEKVPVATGSYNAEGKTGVQTQFTYIDVGLNIDATLVEDPNGVQLTSKVERSSVAPTPAKIGDVNEPIIRQMVLSNTSVVAPGKSVTLGSLDFPDTTGHTDIEVAVEQMP